MKHSEDYGHKTHTFLFRFDINKKKYPKYNIYEKWNNQRNLNYEIVWVEMVVKIQTIHKILNENKWALKFWKLYFSHFISDFFEFNSSPSNNL